MEPTLSAQPALPADICSENVTRCGVAPGSPGYVYKESPLQPGKIAVLVRIGKRSARGRRTLPWHAGTIGVHVSPTR